MNEDVLKRINEEKEKRTGKLDLSKCGLIKVPKEISQMIWLDILNLSDNKLTKIEGFEKLKSLKILCLDSNSITKIEGLENLKLLEILYLSSNKIIKLEGLSNLKFLKVIYLSANEIKTIEGLGLLQELNKLDLSSNNLTKIIGLENLASLNCLDLSYNKISKIEGLENLRKLNELYLHSNQIKKIEGLNTLIYLYGLDLSANDIKKIEGLTSLTLLNELILHSNQIEKIEGIDALCDLLGLDLSCNKITNIEGLESLKSLNTLRLRLNCLTKIEGLEYLLSLNILDLSSNKLTNIEGLKGNAIIKTLNILDLSSNKLTKIEGLKTLHVLSELDLFDNNITTLEEIGKLSTLSYLDVSSNQLKKTEDIQALKDLKSKPNLRIENNEVTKNLRLSENSKVSHLPAVLNLIDRFLENNKVTITLPLKVLLLGNHSSGKSTLLHYLISGEIKEQKSTHILNIEYLKYSETITNLPKAVFFDFGGQDYYHGMYKPFLSHDALYLILWKHSTNRNERILSDANGINCHHFSLSYWLAQKNYLETEMYSDEENAVIDPKFVIQTHYREENNETEPSMDIPEDEKIRLSLIPGKEQKFEDDRQLILSKIDALLEDEKNKREEPKWYVDFLNYLISEGENNDRFRDIVELLLDTPIYNTKLADKEESLMAELWLLHRRGLVLYYPYIDESKYWPGPASFAKYVHDHILIQDDFLLKHKGVISLDDFNVDEIIKKVLIAQKIVFQDDYNKKIIIPGFLRLTTDDDRYERDIENVNRPLFFLQFTKYLPFGYINQLISSIGQQGKHLCYWRDEVYFLLEKIEFRINFDYEHLRISVFANQDPKEEIKTYLFYTLIGEYWGLEMPLFSLFKEILNPKDQAEEIQLEERQYDTVENYSFLISRTECCPKDLYISFDNEEYVEYQSIWACTNKTIPCFPSRDNIIDLDLKGKTCEVGPFKKLIKNKNMIEEKKMKKVFISYSRKDVDFKNELRNHLNLVKTLNIFDNWSCEDINFGRWDDQIQQEIESSDLIVYMLSANFFSSRYILEKEVLKGMKLIEENPNKQFYCVVVRDFIGLDKLKDPNKTPSELENAILNLSNYQYGVYGYELNYLSNDNKEKIVSLEDWKNQGRIHTAMTKIVEKMVEFLK